MMEDSVLVKILRFLNTLMGLQSFPIFVGYLSMIFLSSAYQKNTKPLSLAKILVIYNFTCCLTNLWTFIAFIVGLAKAGTVFRLESNDWLEHAFLLYWLSKIGELMDTVFMVLRHRKRQISFLHVYHHSSMVLLTDFAYHFSPWAGIAFLVSINAFVHVCLYLYYGYAALNPNNPPSWKKHVTELQLTQFAVGMIHALYGYFYHNFCIYGFFFGWSMIILFGNYYVRAFILKPKQNQKVE